MSKKKGQTTDTPSIGESNGNEMKNSIGATQEKQLLDNIDFETFKESLSDFFDCKSSSVGKVSEMWGNIESYNKLCSYCKKESVDLKKCKGCKTVSYCGRECQKADWSQHKVLCLKKKNDETITVSESTVKELGRESDSDAKGDSKHDEKGTCFYCNATKDDMKKCARCKTAAYCDKQCQKADWPEHKMLCGQMHTGKENWSSNSKERSVVVSPSVRNRPTGADGRPTTSPGIKSCLFCEKIKTKLVKCSQCKIAEYCDERCKSNHRLKHKVACENLPIFHEALVNASEILADFHGCVKTEMVFPQSSHSHIGFDRTALLVRIVEPYFHPFRHSVIVQDVNGEKAPMIFYNDKSEELQILPKNLGSMLTPGNFIKWFNPRWHFFLDGSVGFRIESLKDLELLQSVTRFTFSPL